MKFAVRGVGIGLALAALAGASVVAQAQAPAGPSRVAFVNARLVLQGMPGYTEAESTFTKELEAGRDELEKLQVSFDSAVAAFEQQEPMLSSSVRETRRKELQTRGQQLQQKNAEIQQRLGARERELLTPMQQRLTAVIEGLRAEGNYAMIIDLGAEGLGIITYDKSLDITDRVVQRLRAAN